MHIKLIARGDGLGANLTFFIGQFIFAIHNKLYIKYNRNNILEWNNSSSHWFVLNNSSLNMDIKELYDSIFIQTIFDMIDNYNKTYIGDEGELLDFNEQDYYSISKSVIDVKCDLISYFKNNIYDENIFLNKAIDRGYKIDFDIKKTILVHLRLLDVRDIPDYDGSLCSSYLEEKINNDEIITYQDGRYLFDRGLNKQAPIPYTKIEEQIKKMLEKNPTYEVVIITAPGEDNYLPYRYIQSDDYNYDLFLLTQSECVILSKSTFGITSLFFGNQKEVYLPLWGHLSIFGLHTKYDNTEYSYFI
jgi:hypothetical protein